MWNEVVVRGVVVLLLLYPTPHLAGLQPLSDKQLFDEHVKVLRQVANEIKVHERLAAELGKTFPSFNELNTLRHDVFHDIETGEFKQLSIQKQKDQLQQIQVDIGALVLEIAPVLEPKTNHQPSLNAIRPLYQLDETVKLLRGRVTKLIEKQKKDLGSAKPEQMLGSLLQTCGKNGKFVDRLFIQDVRLLRCQYVETDQNRQQEIQRISATLEKAQIQGTSVSILHIIELLQQQNLVLLRKIDPNIN